VGRVRQPLPPPAALCGLRRALLGRHTGLEGLVGGLLVAAVLHGSHCLAAVGREESAERRLLPSGHLDYSRCDGGLGPPVPRTPQTRLKLLAFAPGELVFRESDPGHELCLLRRVSRTP
jgi:hypothetical protein